MGGSVPGCVLPGVVEDADIVQLFDALDQTGTGRVSHDVFASYVMQVFAERFIRKQSS